MEKPNGRIRFSKATKTHTHTLKKRLNTDSAQKEGAKKQDETTNYYKTWKSRPRGKTTNSSLCCKRKTNHNNVMAQKPGAHKRLTRQKKMGKTTGRGRRELGSRTSLMGGGGRLRHPFRTPGQASDAASNFLVHFHARAPPHPFRTQFFGVWEMMKYCSFLLCTEIRDIDCAVLRIQWFWFGGLFSIWLFLRHLVLSYSDGACCQDDGDLSFLFLLNYIYLLSFVLHFPTFLFEIGRLAMKLDEIFYYSYYFFF